ncbi:MAG: hypothetical protein WBA88_23445 [Pseudaminobacter sp.]
MTQAAESEAATADTLMDRLQADAKRASDLRRVGTLIRLVEACDEILSGGASKLAKSARQDPEIFNPNFVKLNSRVIEQYVRFRSRLDGSGSEWSGPVATTIRGDRDLMTYLKLRDAESKRPGRPKRPTPLSRRADDIIDRIDSIHDQALLREVLAKGREAKRQLDIMVAALRKHPEIDVEALREGRYMPRKVDGPQAQSAVSADDTKLIRKLATRLRNNDELEEFDLVHRSGRVKMSQGAGLDLIYPEEMRLIERLAGLEGTAV